MDAWVWIVLAVIAVLVIAGIVFAATRGRQRRLESRREEASALRDRAEMRTEQAEQRAAAAEQRRREADAHAEEAKREREAADAAARRADELDPDVD
jgi:flagellar biosynthesis/type III secretory pathway M-ring protein FliF/YscJ